MAGTRRHGNLRLVPSCRIAWHNPCGDGGPLGEQCEVLECFEEDGCTYFQILLGDGEEMVVPSDELDLDCQGAGIGRGHGRRGAPAAARAA